ncbi:glucose PTS transporter subunit IIA [Actinomyces sp. MRS3W]|uniref:glucose PTS transporter subunit IIA n=1 Tax=Actinomyces sp. MRS3W TaxID=2800796 RepID=UPI0028FDC43A|nr:glucose PTS transporter subunit IIA [Actinomyces sp. MRS3W]MDU0347286.1 glucose PTS transporter subunit IIA [Actinomyces sp. MRS3W]
MPEHDVSGNAATARDRWADRAAFLLAAVGGADNVRSLSSCATRLRFVLFDADRADDVRVHELDEVVSVVRAGGQYQVVIGDEAANLHAALTPLLAQPGAGKAAVSASRPGMLAGFLELISALIGPLTWPLVGAGLVAGYTGLAVRAGLLAADGVAASVLGAVATGVLGLLPAAVAITAARRFRASEFTALALGAGLLVYGMATAPAAAPTLTTVPLGAYAGAFVPVVLAVWLQARLEAFLSRLPAEIRGPLVPALTLTVIGPLLALVIAPATGRLTGAIAAGTTWLAAVVPWLLGILLGGGWQLLVQRGLHWLLVPFMLNELIETGTSPMLAMALPAVLAQGAASLGAAVRSRDPELRRTARSGAVSGIVVGVTEPSIYGVNLPLRTPFIAGCIGGAVGGLIMALGHGASIAYVLPSLIALPVCLVTGDTRLILVGAAAAMLVAFLITVVVGLRPPTRQPQPEPQEPSEPAQPDSTAAVLAPVAGRVIALTDVPDPVFAQGMMGPGVGIEPDTGRIVAPVSGEVTATAATRHGYAIRTATGLEVLVHVGIDTVSLQGRGFTPHVAKGEHVEAGAPLVDVDLDVLRDGGCPTTVLVVVISAEHRDAVAPAPTGGRVSVGDALLTLVADTPEA